MHGKPFSFRTTTSNHHKISGGGGGGEYSHILAIREGSGFQAI